MKFPSSSYVTIFTRVAGSADTNGTGLQSVDRSECVAPGVQPSLVEKGDESVPQLRRATDASTRPAAKVTRHEIVVMYSQRSVIQCGARLLVKGPTHSKQYQRV